MIKKLFSILSLCGCLLGATSCQYTPKTVSTGRDLAIADSMFTHILDKYNVEKYGLLQETYPANPDNQVTYLAEGAEQKRNQEVSFLWPYSGMLSGGIALYKTTGDTKYLKVLEERILPGLEQYWDNIREPFCYQSYPMFNGESDRFYDDNDWLAIDFCDLYALTKEISGKGTDTIQLYIQRMGRCTGRRHLLVRAKENVQEHMLQCTRSRPLHETI